MRVVTAFCLACVCAELLVQLVTKNREKLLDKGNQAARSRGIGVQLCDVAVRKL